MSKYHEIGAPSEGHHGFKTDAIAAEVAAENAWRSCCAKLGQAGAGDIRAGGTVDELHDKRKNMRRAVNKLNESIGLREATAEEAGAMAHASVVVSKIEGLLDGLEDRQGDTAAGSDWRDSSGRPVKQLRSQADFNAHYRGGRDRLSGDISLSAFFRGVANLPTTAGVRNSLSEGTNSAGGFAVPNILMPAILGALVPNSALLQAGMPIVPLDQGAKTYTTAIVSGIPTAAWRSENGAVAESDPVFSAVVAAPQSLSFFFKISRELLADAPNLEQALMAAIGQAMAKELDRAGLRGTGTAPQPRGILNTAGIQSVTNGANGASLASYANLLSAAQALLTADAPMPTAAIMAPRSLVKLAGLVDTTTQPLRRPPMLESLPMLSTSQIPVNLTVGTSTDCTELYIGDFSKMAMMLRQGLSVQLLSELYAGTGQLAFMCHCRADFAVMYPAAFALVTGVRA